MSACYDTAYPGTGPMRYVGTSAPSVELEKYNSSYNLSLRSKSDYSLNPQPEGFVKAAFTKAPENREGIYAIETDRGELSATAYTQVNVRGKSSFTSRLQDPVRPTMKETTLYAYDSAPASRVPSQSLYSQFLPDYQPIDGKMVRVGGSTNYGLRAATEYSYFPGAAPTGINKQTIQNPDVVVDNLYKKPDFNVDGPGTFKAAMPNAERFQNYRLITAPTSNGLRFNYNLETQGSDLHDYSELLGKKVNGIENRYTASYQIAPLMTNPLNVIWDPDNKGEIPAFYCDTHPQDFSYSNMVRLPGDTFVKAGYNDTWAPDNQKTSINSYVLGLEEGIHNSQIEWQMAPNNRPGVIYDSAKALPATCYSGNRSVDDLYFNDTQEINKGNSYMADNTYTTLGDPSAGFIGYSVNGPQNDYGAGSVSLSQFLIPAR